MLNSVKKMEKALKAFLVIVLVVGLIPVAPTFAEPFVEDVDAMVESETNFWNVTDLYELTVVGGRFRSSIGGMAMCSNFIFGGIGPIDVDCLVRAGNTMIFELDGAYIPQGYRFSHWRSNVSIDFDEAQDSRELRFTMPAEDVVITAVYELAVPAANYREVTVVDGIVVNHGSTNEIGSMVGIRADNVRPIPQGYRFRWESSVPVEWTANSPVLPDGTQRSQWASFIMPASDVNFTAILEPIPAEYLRTLTVIADLGWNHGPHVLEYTVELGTWVHKSNPNPPQGYRFVGWEPSVPVEFVDVENWSGVKFIMPDTDLTLTAIFESGDPIDPIDPIDPYEDYREVTVTNGTVTGGSMQEIGAIVEINADTPPDGFRFVGWGSNIALDFDGTQNNASASFIMPDSDVTLVAIFEEIPVPTHTATVNGGTGGGSFVAGTTVSIQATVPTGQRFVRWESSSAVTFANANNANTTFVMPSSNVTVRAIFEEIQTDTVAVLNHSVPLRSGPSASYASLGTVWQGTRVTVLETSACGEWSNIEIGWNTGWVLTVRLNHVIENDVPYLAVMNQTVPLRVGPNGSYISLGNVTQGKRVMVLGTSACGEWSNIEVGWHTGWVLTMRLNHMIENNVPHLAIMNQTIPLRVGPNGSYTSLGNVTQGKKVMVLGTSACGEWTNIKVGWHTGWVRAESHNHFIKNSGVHLAIVNQAVPLRSAPDDNHASLGNVTRGKKVMVLGTSENGDWTLIHVGWHTGWVMTAHLN